MDQAKEEKMRKEKIREQNDITKFSYKLGIEYLEDIRFSIPLQDIFSVVDSCHFNFFEEYCPVLVKLGKDYDKHLKSEAKLKELSKYYRYQLQIWRKETKIYRPDEGVMIF